LRGELSAVQVRAVQNCADLGRQTVDLGVQINTWVMAVPAEPFAADGGGNPASRGPLGIEGLPLHLNRTRRLPPGDPA
jgi:hypothetical protein